MKYHEFKNTGEYVEASVKAIEDFLAERLKGQKIVRVALSGGSSPVPVYEALAKSKRIPWSRVALFLVDERYVPLNSKDSNYGMIKKALADRVKNLRKFYHYNTRNPIETIVDQYQKTLEQFESPLFDLVLLGLGSDVHTASLFPGSPALHEKNRLVLHTTSPETNTFDRMSLTFPAIMNSGKIIFLIQGSEKKQVVDRLVDGGASADELPASAILEHEDVEIFYEN